jgi:hypothetical protein
MLMFKVGWLETCLSCALNSFRLVFSRTFSSLFSSIQPNLIVPILLLDVVNL